MEPSAVIISCSAVSLENARAWVRMACTCKRRSAAGRPGGFEAPPRFEWIADTAHPTMPRCPQQRSEHPGKGVDMFVGVDVADGESARLNPPYLGDGLGLDLLLADAAAQTDQLKSFPPWPGRTRASRGRAGKALHPGAGKGTRRPAPRDSRPPAGVAQRPKKRRGRNKGQSPSA